MESKANYFYLKDHHKDCFGDYVQYFLAAFGLTDWEVRIGWYEGTDCRARLDHINEQNRLCSIELCRNWVDAPDSAMLKHAAFHEVMELLLVDCRWLVERADWTQVMREVQMSQEQHKVIRRLEHYVLSRDDFEVPLCQPKPLQVAKKSKK